jgi:DNA-directed RNA polymerase subunit beta
MLKRAPNRESMFNRKEIVDLPNLIEIQLRSYDQFLQAEILSEDRRNIGLEETFREVFPVRSYDEKTVIEYLSYHLGSSTYNQDESLRRGITFGATLKVKFRLTDETGIKEEEVYMGTIPLMTDRGTFVINGAERVVVSQLHRSPGIAFEVLRHPKGINLYNFRVIPYRGSWLESSFDINDMLYIYIDRKKRRRKILATTFIRALGYSSDADIIEEFFEVKKHPLKTQKDIALLVGKILAADIFDQENNLFYGRAGEKLTTAMLKRMLDAKVVQVLIAQEADETHPIIKMLGKDPTDSYESALKDFYRKIRPGEPATLANARSAMMRLFFDPKRYNLGRVGRYKLNTKLKQEITEESSEIVTLTKEDIICALKYLISLKFGDPACTLDDIDHLGNRRVRSVGELVQNQCRIGLARMEKMIRERMNLFDFTSDTLTPGKIVSAKGLTSVLKDFFGRSQLSQFMEQTNPIAELTHKRRLSCLGPGGLNRDRAGFEVRDVHPSHYGRICPIETPEGPNIGLITSLASFAKINEYGFLETPYRIIKEGVVSDEIEYMTADQEEHCIIAQASSPLDEFNMFSEAYCWAHYRGEPIEIESKKATHMDVSPKQLVSIVTGLIPFLEHDDANRALMGSNMQRQAVPLLIPEAPFVGTGLEQRAARDSGAVVLAKDDGVVEFVDGTRIVVVPKTEKGQPKTYHLKKFIRSNSGSCINQKPLCSVGDVIKAGDIIADGPATDLGEIALGKNVLVAFMPWYGYNFEDAIIISEKLSRKDAFTSLNLEELEITIRTTKLGDEEFTRDIPNVSEEALMNLGDDGIIRIGAEVKPGDILVGKISPKTETELAPEERLLRAVFGEKAADVKNASLVVPPGISGVVIEAKVFSRVDRVSKSATELVEDAALLKELQLDYKAKKNFLLEERTEYLAALLVEEIAPHTIVHRRTADVIIEEQKSFTEQIITLIEEINREDLLMPSCDLYDTLKDILHKHDQKIEILENEYKHNLEKIRKGDTELEAGVIRQVRVCIASKRKLEVGDKMAGRHGNKGVVSNIVPEADMPYLEDGTSIEIILNPLGLPSRMNMGQLFETHLGFAAKLAGINYACPVFEGYSEEKINQKLKEQGIPENGKLFLRDGYTGVTYDNPTVVGYIYMIKLNHLVADKIHARATGPYSLVTQQPLGGKAQRGGQRFGEMEVWAAEAYGAAYLLQELLTVKSDDIEGRTEIYKSIVHGDNTLKAGIPESFHVLLNEMKGLCLDIRTIKNED